MPKYGIHHIVIKESVGDLLAMENTTASRAADIIRAEMPSAIIGSIGPDLFFWGPDYEVVAKLYKLHQNITDVVDLYNKIVEPIRAIKDAVGEPIEDLVETLAPETIALLRRALEEINETSALFKSAVGTGILAGVLDGVDLLTNAGGVNTFSHQFFQEFVPKFHYNKREDEWYWFNMLHYRRTGKFAQQLVKNSKQLSQQAQAFAFGYLSHIATDVTGHPYVNQIVGAPYRLNVQRHIIVENYMDTWKFANYYQDTNGNGESINQKLFSRLGLPESLPTDIGDLLLGTFSVCYENPPRPKFYSREQIDITYDVFYKVLKLMENMYVERPEEPFSGVADILADALNNFSKPPAPPDIPSSSCSFWDVLAVGITERSRECYESFFEEMANWFNWLGELLVWTLETLLNLLDLLLTLFLLLPISVLLAILYGMQLLCYQAYKNVRAILSTSGFVMPEPDELNSSIGRNLTTLFHTCAANFETFPRRGTLANSPLICPIPITEQPNTASGFNPVGIATTPDNFIRFEPFREQAVSSYARQAQNPGQTRSIQRDKNSIGNAIAFTAWMIQHANKNEADVPQDILEMLYADWNLDGDRGYGYRAWYGEVPHNEPFTVAFERYTPYH